MGKSVSEIFDEIRLSEDGRVKDDRPYITDCMALVACDGNGHGIILQAKQYLSDYGLDLAPQGVSIWEGKSIWCPGGYECPQDGSTEFEGEFRRLTAEEAAKVQVGDLIWPEEEDVDEDEGTEEQGNVSPVRDDLGQGT